METFPILWPAQYRKIMEPSPASIPFAVIAPHERQALKNHHQTLEELARRGGLSVDEAVAVIERRKWFSMGVREAAEKLCDYVAAHERRAACGTT